MCSVYYLFMSCVIAYLFIHTIVVSSFVLRIYLCSYFLKILYSAVLGSLISYRVIISSNDGCREVKECKWRLTILALLLTYVQLSASPEKVFFLYGKRRLYVESVVYLSATVIGKIFQRSGIDKVPEDHAARGHHGSRCPSKYWVLKFVVKSFVRTEFVFSGRREYSEIWEQLR